MTPERWQRVTELFWAALERQPNQRADFLAQATADDPALVEEVLRMLASDAKAWTFLSGPRGPMSLGLGETADHFAGRTLSRYRLEEPLGAGGMGLLYRATDLTLGRSVAIKLLARHLLTDEAAKARFVREARAASALDHPNIGSVFDIGEQDGELFIVMALYDGETIKQRLEKGPLPLGEVVAILRQVASGLEAAHRAGIVHRDIKPANIEITSNGTVKILDFGVAKLLGESQAQMTQTGQVMGTVLYMSPEQLSGEPVDARSDLWSVGVLAYEMLAGVSPFQAESSTASAARILHDEPTSLAGVPGVPDWLVLLASELFRKNPAQRPQSATQVLSRLSSAASDDGTAIHPKEPRPVGARLGPVLSGGMRRAAVGVTAGALLSLGVAAVYFFYSQGRVGRGPSAAAKSLVVLPFLNASANPDMEYLSDGIAESLIDNLSQLPDLRVIARNTAFGYKGKDVDLQSLGRELSADTVLTGRVQQRGETLIVHADLVNLADRSQLWGEKYNRKLTDLPALEEDIAKAILDKLRPRLTADLRQRLTTRSTESSEAYQLYLRGRYFWNKRTKDGFDKSVEFFEQAIQVDPKYALAYAGLADAYTSMAFYALVPTTENVGRAEAAALQALALDEKQAEGHATLGVLKMMQWHWLEAEKQYKRSIESNPNYASAHGWYGMLLHTLRRLPEAVAEYDRASQLDPATGRHAANLASTYCKMSRYDDGIAQMKKAMALGMPNNGFVQLKLGNDCYVDRGMYQEAIKQLKEAVAINPEDPRFLGALGYAYAQSGHKDLASSLVNELIEKDRRVDMTTAVAWVYIGLGDNERALQWLEKAYQRRSPFLPYATMRATSPELRSDPRFQDLLRRLGLPQ